MNPKSDPHRPAKTVPSGGEAHLISVRVLNDQPLERVGLSRQDSETNRASVVLYEQSVSIEALDGQKALDYSGKLVESVAVGFWVRSITVSEPRIVGGDDVKLVAECADQVAILM